MRHLSALILIILTTSLLASCLGEPSYPHELASADSLFRQGHYEKADSILSRYDSTCTTTESDILAYRQLLELEKKFVAEALTEYDFSLSDSLSRYYKAKDYPEKYARSLLFLGNVCHAVGDFPTALSHYLKALEISHQQAQPVILGWISQGIGDLYFDQRMFNECMPYYQQYFAISQANNDTLRMALASFRMGLAHTIKNQIDSTIIYFQRAIRLGEQQQQTDNQLIVPLAKEKLADIYIQTEQFDKAEQLMHRNADDDQNWAYWHLGQQHTDSAVYYFLRILDQYGWEGKAWFLRELATIEQNRGNIAQSNTYYRDMAIANDSAQAQSQTNETRRANAQYNYNFIQRQRDAAARYSQDLEHLLLAVCIVVMLAAYAVTRSFRNYKRRKEEELEHERRLRREEESQSVEKTALFRIIKKNADKDDFHLSEAEWDELSSAIDLTYNRFTIRLLALNNSLSEHEIRVCYLIKLGLSSVAIARMLFKTDKAIFMTRQRLYAKLTGKEGTAKQLSALIRNF